jgi:hypothetical protein
MHCVAKRVTVAVLAMAPVLTGSTGASADVELTPAMWDSAAEMERFQTEAKAQKGKLVADLDSACARGGTDSCFASIRLQHRWAASTSSDTVAKDARDIRKKFDALADLCARRHAASCLDLGEVIDMHVNHAGLPDVSDPWLLAIHLEPVLRGRRPRLAGRHRSITQP